MPALPLNFNGDHCQYLDVQQHENLYKTTWMLPGFTVYHTAETEPKRDDFLAHTPRLVFHGYSGFSLGQFSEFFVRCPSRYEPRPDEFAYGAIEVTVGDATPLAAYLFETAPTKGWNCMSSLRLQGADCNQLELLLLNAILRYELRHAEQLHVVQVAPISWMPEVEIELGFPEEDDSYPFLRELEPLRCFYRANVNESPISACIQYCRVLEFYAFSSPRAEVVTSEHASTLEHREISLTPVAPLSGAAKALFIQFLNHLIEQFRSTMVADAADAGLIPTRDVKMLSEALSDFRNAIVQAKYLPRSILQADSLVSPFTRQAWDWHVALKKLAGFAIRTHSAKMLL